MEHELIRQVQPEDYESIEKIYNHYVSNTSVTFEETTVSSTDIQNRVEKSRSSNLPWLVMEISGSIVGYAYATKWKERAAYRFSVESSVYVSEKHHGKGYGTLLYTELLKNLNLLDVNSVIGGITLPNLASVALHEKLGMKKVAHFSNVGFKFDKWLDVGYWQLKLRT
ncbi:arsinothricin resistance N-acetyltransferase ArsN1 family B [Alteromonas macleodii]|uniref:Putative Phosphinothricin N-acetyltransferase n=1 Tax=Alteromonas macleodii TaxID=28108 RepID=A0A6T9XZL7_ALTMA|nr:arsinothricin resistance N-acetyltransferase ArsN1 family B [Alteromonas macleodii]CAB9494200.1 putative Phosphinothricin N-acetyltransferase [Alteromonas macleodii]